MTRSSLRYRHMEIANCTLSLSSPSPSPFPSFFPPSLPPSPTAHQHGAVGGLSPSTPAQPPPSPFTDSLSPGFCPGEGRQVSDHGMHSSGAKLYTTACPVYHHSLAVCSLLHELRCLVHFELAKVCADQSQLQTALEHVNKVGGEQRALGVTCTQPAYIPMYMYLYM